MRLVSLLAALVVLTFGCADPSSNAQGASLEGTFVSSYGDGFRVHDGVLTQYDNAQLDVSFEGTIANHPNLSASSGLLLVQITNGGTWGKTVGTYYGIRWKSLSSAGVEESSASAYPDPTPSPATLAEAQTAFADGSLYTYYGEYARK